MGCCVSTPQNPKTAKNNKLENNNINNPHQFQCVSKSPPRAEEEAVKEVLSETPKPRPRPESPRKRQAEVEVGVEEHDVDVDSMKPKMMLVTPTNKAFLEQKTGAQHPYPDPDPCTPEEISEVSEMCSFSETISTSTLKEDDDLHPHHQHHHQFYSSKDTAASGEARQRLFRSQGYNGNFTQHHHQPQQQHHHQLQQQHYKSQGKSPARRRPEPESSPARRRPPGPPGPRKEAVGDNSARRSHSPGMRANMGRSPSVRKTGPSPGRVRMVHGPENNGRKVQEGEDEEAEVRERRESEEWQGPKESLENPLVSLECFIFL